jgi:outer membrane protein, heavy metal efflux system
MAPDMKVIIQNSLGVVLLSLLFSPAIGVCSPDKDDVSPLTLQAAVDMAVRDNPSLAQIQSRSESMAAIPAQKGSLPDPMLSFNAMNIPTDTFDLSQEPMTQMQFGVMQAIPFPGKLALREEASSFAAEAAVEDVDEARLLLIQNVKSSWWQLHYLDRAIEIVGQNQNLFRQFVAIASTKYETGAGLQQDVLLAQVELSKLLDKQIQLTGLRQKLTARFNKLLNKQANESIVLAAQIESSLPDIVPEEELYAKALSSRPLLNRQEFKIKAAQSRLDLAHKDYYPDFKMGAFYGIRQGENPAAVGGDRADFLTVKFNMTLPIFTGSKQDNAVVQRRSELQAQRYSMHDTVNGVKVQISQEVAGYQQSREQFQLFKEGIIPQARQTVESMLSGYQVNKVDFLNLVRSQMTLLNYENQYWKALTAANQALARLAAAVGEEAVHE